MKISNTDCMPLFLGKATQCLMNWFIVHVWLSTCLSYIANVTRLGCLTS